MGTRGGWRQCSWAILGSEGMCVLLPSIISILGVLSGNSGNINGKIGSDMGWRDGEIYWAMGRETKEKGKHDTR